MFKQIFQHYLSITLIFLIAIVGTLGFTFALKPSLEVYQSTRDQFNEIEQNIHKVKLRYEELQKIKTELDRLAISEIEKLNSFFVVQPEIAQLISVIKKRAQDARFLLTSLEVNPGRKDSKNGPVQEINVQLQMKGGGYDELKEFLRLITRTVPLIDISSFTFDPRSTSASFNFKVYRVKDDGVLQTGVPIDANFFTDPRFSALAAPVLLPDIAPVGKEDPFAVIATEDQELEIRN